MNNLLNHSYFIVCKKCIANIPLKPLFFLRSEYFNMVNVSIGRVIEIHFIKNEIRVSVYRYYYCSY